MTSTLPRRGDEVETRGERTGASLGLSSFLRGLLLGGVAAAFLGFQVGDYLSRRPVFVFDTGYGSVRVSREALESIFVGGIEAATDVVAARVRVRRKRGRMRINLWLYLEHDASVEDTVSGAVSILYSGMRDLGDTDVPPVELVIEDITRI